MNAPAVLAGPAGIGKTRLAPAFMAALGLETLIDPWTPGTPLPDGALGITNEELHQNDWDQCLPSNARTYVVNDYAGLIGTLKFLSPICTDCRHIGRRDTCSHPINLKWDQVLGDGVIAISCKQMRATGEPCGSAGALFSAIATVADPTPVEDSITAALRPWAKQQTEFTLHEAIAGALGVTGIASRDLSTRIGIALRALGYQRYEKRGDAPDFRRSVFYRKGKAFNQIDLSTTPAFPLPELAEGETYVGAILSACGTHHHHTILLPCDQEDLTWPAAMKWAASLGGDLPNRIEQALMFATLKDQFKKDWYWSNTQHAAYSAYAWCQYFDYGHQYDDNTDCKLRARVVRRLPIQQFAHFP